MLFGSQNKYIKNEQMDLNGQLLVALWPRELRSHCAEIYMSIRPPQVRAHLAMTANHSCECGDTNVTLLPQRQIHIS